MKRNGFSGASLSMVKLCFLGVGVALAAQVIFALISAIFISNEYFEKDAGIYLAGVSQFAAVFAGCMIGGKLAKQKNAVVCLVVMAGCLFLQIAAAILFFDGVAGNYLLRILPILAAGGSAVLLCLNGKKHSASRKRRLRSR